MNFLKLNHCSWVFLYTWCVSIQTCNTNLLLKSSCDVTEVFFICSVYMVTEEEWRLLINYYVVDQEIFVTRNRHQNLVTNGSDPTVANNGSAAYDDSLLISSPPVCRECVERRRQQELDERLVILFLLRTFYTENSFTQYYRILFVHSQGQITMYIKKD